MAVFPQDGVVRVRKALLGGMAAFLCSVPALPVASAAAQENNGTFPQHGRDTAPVARIIIGLRPDGGTARLQAAGAAQIQSLSGRTGVRFRAEREINASMRVVDLETPVSGADLDDTLARLASDPAVAFAEPDRRVYRHAIPNDNLFPNQWYLQDAQPSALDAVTAWDVTTGSTGIRGRGAGYRRALRSPGPAAGRARRAVAAGARFRGPGRPGGGFRAANDGDGWDANPADPGDWISASDAQSSLFSGCDVSGSSWHGTRVAGLIGAITNNGVGIAGVTWGTWILPVRVLGKCFGNNSDILQAMRWAAGLHVAGVPANPYPAKIINMSLGASGSCTSGYLNVLNELADAGVLVVASAGNSGGPVEYPGNCPGVAAVTGPAPHRHESRFQQSRSRDRRRRARAAIASTCSRTLPLFTRHDCQSGLDGGHHVRPIPISSTTTSAPVSPRRSWRRIAALMHGVNGNLTPPQLIARLREGAQPFPAPPAGIPVCHVPVNESDVQEFRMRLHHGDLWRRHGECGGRASPPALRPIAAIVVPAPFPRGRT